MKQNGLSRLEHLVRETIEGSFDRLFGGTLEPIGVATRLVQVMEDTIATEGEEANHRYVVEVNPADYNKLLEENPDLAADLADAVLELGRRYGLPLIVPPAIQFAPSPGIRPHSVHISAQDDQALAGIEPTQTVARQAISSQILTALREIDAFLIVQGRRHYALNKPLVTIGRRQDNDIVIDSASISRQHAQIRWRFDYFVLYDVSGRGRTMVNGEKVNECILKPGDVISLSDAMLIYGEGNERVRDQTDLDKGQTLVWPRAKR